MSSTQGFDQEFTGSKGRWTLLALLVVSVAINYIDRGTLSIAAATETFRRNVHIDDKQLGMLFSAFFVTYSVCQVFSGWVIDRWNVYRVYAGGFALWSLATIATGLAGGFSELLGLRLLLGVGEAAGYPAYSKMIAVHFPEQQRGFANSLIDAGSRTGPAIGVLGGGLLAAHYGWRVMFFAMGGAGLLWLLPWCWYALGEQTAGAGITKRTAAGGPSIGAILRQRQAWGTLLGLFCLNYTWYFALSWLPVYLTSERHFTTQQMAVYGSLPFWGIAATSVVCGWVSDRLIRSGADPTKIRIGFVAGGLLLNVVMMAAYLVPNAVISIVLLVISSLALGISSSNCWAVTQTVAGTRAVGKWTGLQNGFGNLAGIIGSYLTGWLVAESRSFLWAFAVTAVVAALGACSYLFLVRRVDEIQWSRNNLQGEWLEHRKKAESEI